VVLLSLSPLVIPKNTWQPSLAGLPYTLWMGILASIVLVLCTFAGSLVHPDRDKKS
jgi:hypothetical protein